jgi:hypothetical protein
MAGELEGLGGPRAALVRHSALPKRRSRRVGIACNGAVLCAAVLVQDTADEKSWLASSMASLRQVWLVRPVATAQCSAGCWAL